MAITIKLDTQAGKTADTLADIKDELKDVKQGAADARGEFEKMKKAEEDQRKLAAALGSVSNAWSSVTKAIKQQQDALAKTTQQTNSQKQQTNALAESFKNLNEMMLREKRLLEDVHREAREYSSDLAALDQLLAKNTISTEQYADQVAKLNKRFSETPKREGKQKEETPGSGLLEHAQGLMGNGGASALLGGLAGGGLVGAASEGLGMIIDGIKGIGEAAAEQKERLREMKDEFTGMSNAAKKFVDDGHNVNQIIDEQQRLAHDLHASLEATVEAYDAVRDGTDELNLSHQQQIALTKTLGEAIQLAGKPLEAASGLMAKLSYAMASGTISGLELKQIMREVPPIADLWTKHFHTTRKGLIDMVDQGKVSVNDLTNVLITDGDKMGEQFKTQGRTIKQWREELKTAYELARGRGVDSMHAMQEALAKTADASIDMGTRQKAAIDLATNAIEKQMFGTMAFSAQFQESQHSGEAAATDFNQVLARTVDQLNKIGDAAEEAEKKQKKLAEAWDNTAPASGLAGLIAELEDVGAAATKAFGEGTKYSREYAQSLKQAELDMKALKMAHDSGSVSAHAFQQKYEALMTTLNGGELPTTIKLWHMATDATKEYQKELETLLKMNKAGAFTPEQFRSVLSQVQSHKPEDPMDKFRGEVREAEQKKLADSMKKMREEEEKTRKESEAFAEQEKKVVEIYNMSLSPQEKAAEQLAELEKLYKDGAITAELYAKAQKKVAEALGDTSKKLTEDWKQAVKEYEDRMKEANQRVAQTFGPVAEAIGKAAAGMESDWESATKAIIAQLIKIIMMKALAAAFGGTGFGDAAASIGGDFMTGITSNTLGGGGGFDSGGQMRMVGGMGGGTDSQIVAIRANPNEQITIDNPGQMANGAFNDARGGSPPMQVKNVNVYDAKQAAYEALNSREGHKVLVNWVTQNADWLRGYLVR